MLPRYLNLYQYEKNSFSLINTSAAVFVAVAIFTASAFKLPSFLLSPQWTVSPNLVKCDLISFEASSISFLDRNRYAVSST